MYNLPEEPILDCVMRTGYPPWSQPEPLRCECCDEIIPEDATAYHDSEYEYCCEKCLLRNHSY